VRQVGGPCCRWIVSSGNLQSGIIFQPRSGRLHRVYMTAICSWSSLGKVGSDRGVCQFRYRSLNIQIARCVPLERLIASDRVKAELDAEIVEGINATSERERSKLVQHSNDVITRSWLRSGRKGGSWNALTLRLGQFRKDDTRGPNSERPSDLWRRNLCTTSDHLSCRHGPGLRVTVSHGRR
jgi:hypothetical protein